MMKKLISGFAVLLLVLLVPAAAFADAPVQTLPSQGTTAGGNVSGTVTATGTFQQLFAAAPPSMGAASRHGCTVANYGVNVMYVTEGTSIAASTTGKAVQLQPGQVYYCGWNGTVLYGQVNITGTAGDAFYAAQY
jgi:hypothetical protein